jgi:hypothetical protein
VEYLQTFDFLINFFSLLDWYSLQESAYLELCCSNYFFLFLIWSIFFVLVASRLKHLALGIQVSELLEKALLLLKKLSDSLVEIYFSNVDFKNVNWRIERSNWFASIRNFQIKACIAFDERANFVERLLFE